MGLDGKLNETRIFKKKEEEEEKGKYLNYTRPVGVNFTHTHTQNESIILTFVGFFWGGGVLGGLGGVVNFHFHFHFYFSLIQ